MRMLTNHKKFFVMFFILLLIAVPSTIFAINNWESISGGVKENGVLRDTCGDKTVAYLNIAITNEYGRNPGKDSAANCIFHYAVKYKNLKPGFNKSLGKDIYCKGIKVGTTVPQAEVREGITGPLTEDGNSYIPDGCGYHIYVN